MLTGSAFVEGIGYAAGVLTTLSFLPQVIKTWRARSADGLSATMLVCFTTGISFWLVYGLARASWPIVVSNAITLVLSAMLLFLKCRS
jgi:MtN3 and saliva related transmembrane protein